MICIDATAIRGAYDEYAPISRHVRDPLAGESLYHSSMHPHPYSFASAIRLPRHSLEFNSTAHCSSLPRRIVRMRLNIHYATINHWRKKNNKEDHSTVSLNDKLELWRKDLIDMSRRNPMLYYRSEG